MYEAKVFYFYMAVNNDDDKQLSYNEIDLIDTGEAYFKRLALEIGIDKAVEMIASNDLVKTQFEFIERGLASEYISQLLMRHPEVIERAENAAIETYRGL